VKLVVGLFRMLAFALLGLRPLTADQGIATRFGDPGDRWTGKHLYCTHKHLAPGQLVCAHRTLPCGTVVLLENIRNSRFALCEVLDRGPFAAHAEGKFVLKTHRRAPGEWRSLIDLAPTVANALALNGREQVRFVYTTPHKRPHHVVVASKPSGTRTAVRHPDKKHGKKRHKRPKSHA
jgi:hypothetical protein